MAGSRSRWRAKKSGFMLHYVEFNLTLKNALWWRKKVGQSITSNYFDHTEFTHLLDSADTLDCDLKSLLSYRFYGAL